MPEGSEQLFMEHEALRKLLEKKDQDILILQHQIVQLRNEYKAQEVRNTSEEYVPSSKMYTELKNKFDQMNSAYVQEAQNRQAISQKLYDALEERKKYAMLVDADVEKFKQELVAKAEEKDKIVSDLKNSKHDMETRMKIALEQADHVASYSKKYEDSAKALLEWQTKYNTLLTESKQITALQKQVQVAKREYENAKLRIKQLVKQVEMGKTQDQRHLNEVRANEAKYKEKSQKLEEELKILKENNPTELAKYVQEVANLQAQLEDKGFELQALSEEVDQATHANTELQQQMRQKDEEIRAAEDKVAQHIQQQIRATQQQQKLVQEVKQERDKVAAALHLSQSKEKERKLETDLATQIDKLIPSFKQHLMPFGEVFNKNAMEQQLAEARAQNVALVGTVKALQDEYAMYATKIQKCEYEIKTLADKNEALQLRLQNFSSASANLELEGNEICIIFYNVLDDLKFWKGLVTCSQCDTRRKNCVITKCFHTFCKECVQSNLTVRNRKCPTCKKNFGQGDVRGMLCFCNSFFFFSEIYL